MGRRSGVAKKKPAPAAVSILSRADYLAQIEVAVKTKNAEAFRDGCAFLDTVKDEITRECELAFAKEQKKSLDTGVRFTEVTIEFNYEQFNGKKKIFGPDAAKFYDKFAPMFVSFENIGWYVTVFSSDDEEISFFVRIQTTPVVFEVHEHEEFYATAKK